MIALAHVLLGVSLAQGLPTVPFESSPVEVPPTDLPACSARLVRAARSLQVCQANDEAQAAELEALGE